jgi:colanic acid/amylovoran biosynthesis glycosyltransferase
MEVMVFARHFPILTEGFVEQQCAGLRALGLSLTILADGPYGSGLPHPEIAGSDIRKQVRYHHIPPAGLQRLRSALRLLAAGPPSGLTRRLALLNPWIVGLQAATLRLPFQAATVSRCRPPDLLHAHFGPMGAMATALRTAGIAEAPLITSYYGYDVSKTAVGTSAWAYRGLFRTGELHLVLSETMRLRLQQMGAPAERIAVHPLGVDLSLFHPHRPRARPTLQVLSIARLVPKKGIGDGLRAVAAAAAHIRLHYSIVGDGPCRSEWEALAASLGIADRVTFLGWRLNRDVVTHLHQADVLLVPSATAPDGDAEGTPVVILEAQAAGIPVVATRHAGIPEIVAEGESTRLVAENDWSAMKDSLLELTDPALRRVMGEAGRSFVERHHDSRRLSRRLLEHYECVIAGRVVS